MLEDYLCKGNCTSLCDVTKSHILLRHVIFENHTTNMTSMSFRQFYAKEIIHCCVMSPRAKSLHHVIFESWHSSQDDIHLRETFLFFRLKWGNMYMEKTNCGEFEMTCLQLQISLRNILSRNFSDKKSLSRI